MVITQNGNTTTVDCDGNTFKVTYSNRFRRFQIKKDGLLLSEAVSFQDALNQISEYYWFY